LHPLFIYIFLISISNLMKFIRHSADVYSSEARQLAYRLLEFMARGAGAEPASLRAVFEGQTQGMRVNYYPPCRQQADRVLGLTPHTDVCGLTLLLLQKNLDVQACTSRRMASGSLSRLSKAPSSSTSATSLR